MVGKGLIILVFTTLLLVFTTHQDVIKGTRISDDGKYTLQWTLDEQRQVLTLKGTVKTQGWVGVGVDDKNQGNMIHSALYVIEWDYNNKGTLHRYLGKDVNGRPDVNNGNDKNLSLKLISAQMDTQAGTVSYELERNLNAEGVQGDYSLTDSLTTFIYAFAKENTDKTIAFHGDNHGSFTVNLWQPDMDFSTFWNFKQVSFTGQHIVGGDLKNNVHYTLNYFTDLTNQKVLFHFSAPTPGWVGLGLGPLHGMANASLSVGFLNATAGVNEMRGFVAPRNTRPTEIDGVPIPFGVHHGSHWNSIQRANHFFYSRRFTEALAPYNIAKDKTLFVLFARSGTDSSTFGYHGNGVNITHGVIPGVNLFANHNPGKPTPPAPKDTLKKILLYGHGVAMTLAWAVCSSIGIFVSRFLKPSLPIGWMRLHIGVFVVAIFSCIAGFVLILANRNWKLHFDQPHTIIGFVIFIGTFIQPVIGVVADRMFDPERSYPPVFPDQLHWYFGRILWIMGMYNIYLGLELANVHFAFRVAYYFWVSFVIAVFVFKQQPGDQHVKNMESDETRRLIDSM